jgi:hypothetical protein
MNKSLEHAIAKVLSLPDDRQQLAAELLEEVAIDDVYLLNDDERRAIEQSMQQAKLGQFASDNEMSALWKKCGL